MTGAGPMRVTIETPQQRILALLTLTSLDYNWISIMSTPAWCSPSCSAFMSSGRLPIHVNDKACEMCYNPANPASVWIWRHSSQHDCSRRRLAMLLTMQVGKWHVRLVTPDHIPIGRGFDSSFGYLNADNNYYNGL